MSIRSARLAAVAVAVVVALLSAGPASAATRITGSGQSWSPSRVVIHRGTSVRWHAGLGNHTVRAYGGNWRFFHRLNQGTTTRARRFRRRGTFRFYCTIHGSLSGGVCHGMCGRVVVRRGAARGPYRIGR